MNNKADANMWWIIIGAVMALVVMIVLLVFFTDKSGDTGRALMDCESKGGECVPYSDEAKCPSGSVKSLAFQCSLPTGESNKDKRPLCCFKSPEEE